MTQILVINQGKQIHMAKKIYSIIAAIAVLTGIIFGVNAYEAKFATAKDIENIRCDIELLGDRLENKILEDKIHDLNRRVWALEDRYGGDGVPVASAEIRNQYRELKQAIELAKAKVGAIATKSNIKGL